jgi:hypothetical protein
MIDNYKDDMKELRGQESALEQKLRERQRVFQQKGDTRDVSTLCNTCQLPSFF